MSDTSYPEWLSNHLSNYKELTNSASLIISTVLSSKEIEYLSVTGRTKSYDSISKKIERKGYDDPNRQMTDISGIRIITFFESQLKRICEVIPEIFTVDIANSSDKSEILGSDKTGYKSVHFVCSLGESRANLLEYQHLKELKFEIQVRTVLQHAWAELAHDRSYKFSGILPQNIQRKLNLYAGTLELVDIAFDEISNSVDAYRMSLEDKNIDRIAGEDINSISLSKLISDKLESFGISLDNLENSRGASNEVIRELHLYGLNYIEDVSNLFTLELADALKSFKPNGTIVGTIRSMLMFNDIEKYLERSNPRWKMMKRETFDLLSSKYGEKRVRELNKKYGIFINKSK